MKKALFILISVVLSVSAFAQNTITTASPVQTSFCAGGNLIVTYTTTGTFATGCTFTCELSDGLGNFGSPVAIGSIPLNLGVIAATIPQSTSFGVNYRVRVTANNPVTIGSSSTTPIIITSTGISASIASTPSSNTICEGDSVSLWVLNNSSYHWSTGETTQTIYVKDSGDYNVTVTNFLTNCEVTSNTVHITVHPTPHVNLGADKELCDGQTLNLNAGSGFTSYLWNTGSTTPTYLVDSTGTFSVTVHDTYGCIGGDTINTLFHHNPVVNLGPDANLCGNSILLNAGPGFSTYNWNSGLSFNPTLLVSTSGAYMVSVIDSNGCNDKDTIQVNIHAIPWINLGNDLSVCGSSITLDAGIGFTGYDWNNGLSMNRFIQVTESGTYYVKITDQYGCINSDTIAVELIGLPLINLGSDILLASTDSLVLDAGYGYSNYLWSNGAQTESIIVNGADYPLGSQIFSVTVTNEMGCINSDQIVVNIVSSTWNSEFAFFPNPFTDELKLISVLNLSGSIPVFYDMLGRYYYPQFSGVGSNMQIQRGSLANGCYMLFLSKDDELHSVGKVVVY